MATHPQEGVSEVGVVTGARGRPPWLWGSPGWVLTSSRTGGGWEFGGGGSGCFSAACSMRALQLRGTPACVWVGPPLLQEPVGGSHYIETAEGWGADRAWRGESEWGCRRTRLQGRGKITLWESKAFPHTSPHSPSGYSALGASPRSQGVSVPESPWSEGYSACGHVPALSWQAGAPHPPRMQEDESQGSAAPLLSPWGQQGARCSLVSTAPDFLQRGESVGWVPASI